MKAYIAARSGRATSAVEVVGRRRGGAAWPVISIVRRPGTPWAEVIAIVGRDSLGREREYSRFPYARGRGSRRRGSGSVSTGLRNLASYSSARSARAAAALSLIALFPAPTGLAVGLAQKESRYVTGVATIRPRPPGLWFPRVPNRTPRVTGTSAYLTGRM